MSLDAHLLVLCAKSEVCENFANSCPKLWFRVFHISSLFRSPLRSDYLVSHVVIFAKKLVNLRGS